MKKHVVTLRQDLAGLYYSACTCGAGSGVEHVTKQKVWRVEDWGREHLEQVERALAHLRRGTLSLKGERDHARKMLDDPLVSEKDKAVWQIIFDGADARLRDGGPPDPATQGLW